MRTKLTCRVALLSLLLLPLAAFPAPPSRSHGTSAETAIVPTTVDGSDFELLLQRHLNAIQARDLKAYAATITRGDTLYLVLPNGKLIPNRSGVLDYHRHWFADTSWKMRFERLRTLVGQDSAVVFFHTIYDGNGDDGKPMHSEGYLTMTFRREAQGWALIHDQNTPIVLSRPK